MLAHKHVCSVYSGDVAVNFYSDIDLFTRFVDHSYTRFVPEFQCFPDQAQTAFAVEYWDSEDRTLNYGANVVRLRYPWSLMREGETILYLAYPYHEYQRQQRGALTCHAAAFAIDDNAGYLILGKEGAGKTSTVIALCRDRQKRLIANDLCLLGKNEHGASLLGGTKFFFVRRESMMRNLPELLDFFPPASRPTDSTSKSPSSSWIVAFPHRVKSMSGLSRARHHSVMRPSSAATPC